MDRYRQGRRRTGGKDNMILINDNYMCSNCGSKQIKSLETNIPGISSKQFVVCNCCSLLIKREI